MLHPLQVVELPRQKPDAALALFADVAPHLRILVVGGDGSGKSLYWQQQRGGGPGTGAVAVSARCPSRPRPASPTHLVAAPNACLHHHLHHRHGDHAPPAVAWVLSSLESLKAAQEARGVPDWKPPPVAVLPLGTGGWTDGCVWKTGGGGAGQSHAGVPR